MDDTGEEEENLAKASIHKPFQPKFMKELNAQNVEKPRKYKKKSKEPQSLSVKKLEHFQSLGVAYSIKSIKKLP